MSLTYKMNLTIVATNYGNLSTPQQRAIVDGLLRDELEDATQGAAPAFAQSYTHTGTLPTLAGEARTNARNILQQDASLDRDFELTPSWELVGGIHQGAMKGEDGSNDWTYEAVYNGDTYTGVVYLRVKSS